MARICAEFSGALNKEFFFLEEKVFFKRVNENSTKREHMKENSLIEKIEFFTRCLEICAGLI